MKKCRKIQVIIWCILIALMTICNSYVMADDENDDEKEIMQNEIEQIMTETVANPVAESPKLNARSAIIYDRTTKEIIWGKNETQKRAMASTTKIMTAIIVLENSKLSDIVIVSKKAAATGGSTLKINTGDKITVGDLLYGLMLRSRK